jgi:hypothetical protein
MILSAIVVVTMIVLVVSAVRWAFGDAFHRPRPHDGYRSQMTTLPHPDEPEHIVNYREPDPPAAGTTARRRVRWHFEWRGVLLVGTAPDGRKFYSERGIVWHREDGVRVGLERESDIEAEHRAFKMRKEIERAKAS